MLQESEKDRERKKQMMKENEGESESKEQMMQWHEGESESKEQMMQWHEKEREIKKQIVQGHEKGCKKNIEMLKTYEDEEQTEDELVIVEGLPKGITRCKDGRYQARYTYEGKRYSFYGRNVNQLERKLNDIRYEIAHGSYVKEANITVNDWYELWKKEYKATTVKKGTIESYECMYQYYIAPTLSHKKLHEVKGVDLQKLLNELQRAGYSSSTLSLNYVLLNSMFKQALKNEMIKKNPVEQITLPRGEKSKKRRVLTREEQEVLLSYVAGEEIEPVIQLALVSGMRLGELTGLFWSDLDFIKKEINVNGTLKITRTGECYRETPKTIHSTRMIPMLVKTEEILNQTYVRRQDYIQRMKKEWAPLPGLDELVFTREDGKPMTGQYIRKQITHIVDKINQNRPKEVQFESFTPHTLRHTFATRALENGIPPKVVQEILGHSSIKMTLDLYTHVLPQTKADELQKIACLL